MQNESKRVNENKILTIVIIVLILLCVCAMLGLYLINSMIAKDVESTYGQINDSSLLSCESCVLYTDDLCALYEIGNEETYRRAKSVMRMSDNIYSRFFTANAYVGDTHDYSCKIVDVQYAVPESAVGMSAEATYSYYVTLQQTDNATGYAKIYNLIAVYTDGLLCELITL